MYNTTKVSIQKYQKFKYHREYCIFPILFFVGPVGRIKHSLFREKRLKQEFGQNLMDVQTSKCYFWNSFKLRFYD